MAVDEMDPDELPRRALVDTTVALRGFWPDEPDFAKDPRTPNCVAFVKAMLAAGQSMVVAAVTLAEALRFDQHRQIPRTRGIEFGAFDERAAVIFGSKLSEKDLKAVQSSQNASRIAVRYDALIVATAIRHNAECIVSLDDKDLPTIADRAGIKVFPPSAFIKKQTSLDV